MTEAVFGEQLRQARQAAALSLRQLASRVGYDHSYLSQVERGQRSGSAQLARLCDRELRTGGRLTGAYENDALGKQSPADRQASATGPLGRTGEPDGRVGGAPDERPAGAPEEKVAGGPEEKVAGGPDGRAWLEAVRLGLCAGAGAARAEEWAAVSAGYVRDARTVPPEELVPELAGELRLLTREPVVRHAPVAELSVLLAQALTELGEPRAAERWWRTSQAAADAAGFGWVVRGRQAASAQLAGRPLTEVLRLADEAVTAADQPPGALVRALATKAQALGRLGRVDEGREILRELLTAVDHLPTATTAASSLAECPRYESHALEGEACAALKDGVAGRALLQKALSGCPAENVGDKARLQLGLAECLVLVGEFSAGLGLAMRVLVELPSPWRTESIQQAAERVEAALPLSEVGRHEVLDLRLLLARRSGRCDHLVEWSSSSPQLAG